MTHGKGESRASVPWETVQRSDDGWFHAECELGARVRSKRGDGILHGTIVEQDPSDGMYTWLVQWDDGTSEWCRNGELRIPNENVVVGIALKAIVKRHHGQRVHTVPAPAADADEAKQLAERHLSQYGEHGQRTILQKMTLMAALSVRSPNGRFILGYECPQCWSVKMCPRLERWRDIPSAADLNEALARALACCRCKRCSGWIKTREERHRGANVNIGFGDEPCCDACLPAAVAANEQQEAQVVAANDRYVAHRERSLESARDRSEALTLCAHMADLSEEYHRAGWSSDLEFDLWAAAYPDCGLTGIELLAHEVDDLRGLHESAGGWWRWWFEDERDRCGGACGTVFVPTAEWLDLVAQRRTRY